MNTGVFASPVLVHGMNDDIVLPDWPALTMEELQRVLAHYPLSGQIQEIIWHSPRPFSAGCVVQTSTARLFVKRHHVAIRSCDDLVHEHRFIAHLHNNGIPTSTLLATDDGHTACTDTQWTYEVFSVSTGIDVYRDALSWTPFKHDAHAFSAGRALAQLHVAARDYDAPARKPVHLCDSFSIVGSTDIAQAMQQAVDQDPALQSWLDGRAWQDDIAQFVQPLHTELLPFLDGLAPLWTHNDWHASNLLWSNPTEDAQVHAVIDFGLSNQTCALRDLALAIERNVIRWLDIGKTERIVARSQLSALLDGYTSIVPLSREEWLALAALLPLAHVEFALSELSYFHGITHASANATLAWDGFLIGHARWFADDEGQAVLAYLRQKARH